MAQSKKEKMPPKSPIKIFSGNASIDLSTRIAAHFGTELGKSSVYRYSDGEFQTCFEESVRGCTVFIIQSTFPPTDNLFELLLMIDAAKRASAYKIVAVIPYFGFARQDRKDKPRVSIGAKLVADLLQSAGVSRVMTMDLHADQIQGFFNIPVDHLYASSILIPYIQSLNLQNPIIAAPDMGASKRANAYATYMKLEMAICYKQRKKPNVVDQMRIIGDVKNKDVIIVDDMIDTAGTLTFAANMIKDSGAKSVRAAATHPVLSGHAYESIENSALEELIVTDTIPLKKESKKIKVLSVDRLFADVIHKVYYNESISTTFIF